MPLPRPLQRQSIACFFVFAGFACAAGEAEGDALTLIRSEAIRSHTRFLADDLLEGRATGTRGYDIASKYVAAQFEGIGLEPGAAGSFFQPIRFRDAVAIPEQTELRILRGNTSEVLLWGKDFVVLPDSQRTSASLTGQVVFVGQGVVAPRFGIDDYKGLDVRGKIVAFLPGVPASLSLQARDEFSGAPGALRKAAVAAANGATAALLFGDDSPVSTRFFRRMKIWVDDAKGQSDMRVIPLAILTGAGARKVFAGPVPEEGSAPYFTPVSISMAVAAKQIESGSANVIGLLRGSDPRLRDEFVVYTAHLDHLGTGSPVKGDAVYNGVVDNACGVAALIEIARAFRSTARDLRRSIIFVATTGEEHGLLGSDYYVKHPTIPLSQIAANVNIDSIGILYDSTDIVVVGNDKSSLGAVVARAAARMRLSVTQDDDPSGHFLHSDQYSFFEAGIPSLYPFFGYKAVDPRIDGKKVLDEYVRIRKHQPSDDMNQPLDFEAGAKSARFDFLLGYDIAQGDARPARNDADFMERTFGKQ